MNRSVASLGSLVTELQNINSVLLLDSKGLRLGEVGRRIRDAWIELNKLRGSLETETVDHVEDCFAEWLLEGVRVRTTVSSQSVPYGDTWTCMPEEAEFDIQTETLTLDVEDSIPVRIERSWKCPETGAECDLVFQLESFDAESQKATYSVAQA